MICTYVHDDDVAGASFLQASRVQENEIRKVALPLIAQSTNI